MSEPSEVQRVSWFFHPETQTITGEVQGDGRSIVIATIPADPPNE